MTIIILWLFCGLIGDINSYVLNKSSLNSKIVMGSPVNAEMVQYVVSFRKDGQHFCAGCLVSAKDVVTAGRCIYKIRKFQNDSDVKEVAAFLNDEKYEIARTTPYPTYYITTRHSIHNLGHVELITDFDQEVYRRLNAISVPVANNFVNITDNEATIFAYGRLLRAGRAVVRQMSVKIRNDTFCEEHMHQARPGPFPGDRLMCGSPLKVNQRITEEDYGSPLIHDNILIGVVIFKTRSRGGLSFISFIRLNFLQQGFPEMIMKLIPQYPGLNPLKCELNTMNMDFFD